MNLKWDSICLGDAAKVISGFAFKSQDFLEIGIPIIKIKNIRLGTVDLSEADFVTPDFIKKLAEIFGDFPKYFDKGHILSKI